MRLPDRARVAGEASVTGRPSVVGMVARTLRDYGWAGTVAKCCLRPFGVRQARFEELHDAWVDRRLGIRTTAVVGHEQLGGDEGSQRHATSYHAYAYHRARLVYNIYRARFAAGGRRRRFLDVGCGEGRLVFYWAWKGYHGTGIDFDVTLIDRAKANQATFRPTGGSATFLAADARTYLMERESTIISLFNPFDAVILHAFVDRNRHRISETQSVLMYMHDHHASVLADLGLVMVYRDPYLRVSFWSAGPRRP